MMGMHNAPQLCWVRINNGHIDKYVHYVGHLRARNGSNLFEMRLSLFFSITPTTDHFAILLRCIAIRLQFVS